MSNRSKLAILPKSAQSRDRRPQQKRHRSTCFGMVLRTKDAAAGFNIVWVRPLSCLLLAVAVDFAHGQPILPNPAQPGRVEQQDIHVPQSTKREAIVIPATQAQEVPSGADAVRFTLNSVEISGNSVYTTAVLRTLWEHRLGQDLALSEMFDLAKALTAKYRNDGYVLSQVVVPAQSVQGGIFKLQVVEGFVDKIRFSGEQNAQTDLLRAFAQHIAGERPLSASTLERFLLLMNDLPGLNARANLMPSTTPGASDMEIVVSQERVQSSLTYHNRGTRYLGPQRVEASIDFNNLLGSSEKLGLRYITTPNRRLKLTALATEFPLGNHGLKLSLSATSVNSRPDLSNPGLDIVNQTNSGAIGLSYPWLRGRASNLRVRSALAAYDGSSLINGTEWSKDKLRTVKIGAAGDVADRFYGITYGDLEFTKGLTSLGASSASSTMLSRTGGKPDFFKVNFYLARLQSVAPNWSFLVALNAQQSNDLLLSAEQFGLGGDQFLRAYDSSELLGDSGVAGKLELRYNFALDAQNATAYAFVDDGTVRSNALNAAQTSTQARTHGIGLRFTISNRINGYVEFVQPVNKDVASENNRRNRVFSGLSAMF